MGRGQLGWRTTGYVWLLSLVLLPGMALAQAGAGGKRRAKLPEFDATKTKHIFYSNLFAGDGPLEGGRPSVGTIARNNTAPGPSTPGGTPPTNAGEGGGYAWSQLISRATVEDEIKALNRAVQQNVTTPGKFAGAGHKLARLDFSLLATLFAIAGQYDQDIRWKSEAPAVRDMFARAASNTKAGGSSNVYAEAKARRDDLNELVRGGKIELRDAEAAPDWSKLDRPPLMRLLEDRFKPSVVRATANPAEFNKDLDRLRHEAELLAAVSHIISQEGMEFAEDDDYAKFVQQMKQGALDVVAATKLKNAEQARQAVGQITKACDDCHDVYR